ncbi:MAG: DUF4386 domain-containing protein [Chloroflexi bacterium]|nr:DUF4386 domain-containing protein [Chloroflexota bacterium]
MLGFLVLRPEIYVDGDPAATLANLSDREAVARLGVLMEMGIVVTQSLAAVWFYMLLRSVHPVAGVAVAAFGLMNAVAIMASGVFMATAVAVAQEPSTLASGDAVATVGLLQELSVNAWGFGALFFGLWLIPMGWVAIATERFPPVMGWILIAGGIGYVASALIGYGVVDAPSLLVEGITYPATVGEFWMIGYLLVKGIRPAPAGGEDAATALT